MPKLKRAEPHFMLLKCELELVLMVTRAEGDLLSWVLVLLQ